MLPSKTRSRTMRELHLFAGAGGGILGGMLLGHTPVCAVELDAYCRKVLQARQADGWLPQFPIYEDVREFDGTAWRGRVDVVAGGFPCQPWSPAGKREGADDPRHLWPEMARIVEEVRPAYVFAENVSLAALEEPWRDLRGLGYRVPPALCVAAADVGAPHLRKRWWLLAADADSQQIRNQQKGRASRIQAQSGHDGGQEHLADTESQPERPGLQPRQPGEVGRRRPSDGGSAHAAYTDADSGRRQGFAQRDLEPQAGQQASQRDDAVRLRVADTSGTGLAQRQGPEGQWAYAAATGAGWWAAEPDVGRVAHGVAYRVDRLRALGNGQVPMAAATAWHYLMQQLGT
jgi:DNA (cytosine-5)-methyltransferase 1